jgi:Protein of unknown function (DUF3499)
MATALAVFIERTLGCRSIPARRLCWGAMGKLCERPGCSDVAAMAYGFDADRLLVWLAPRDPEGDPLRAGSLCKRHADAMVVPQGWTLDDRREAAPRLFRPAADAPKPAKATRPRRSRAKTAPEPEPMVEVVEVVEVVEAAVLVPVLAEPEPDEARTVAEVTGEQLADDDPDATHAIPWIPTFDAADDLGGVLAARSPLLARAFRGTERKH